MENDEKGRENKIEKETCKTSRNVLEKEKEIEREKATAHAVDTM